MKKINIYIFCSKAQIKTYLNYFNDCNFEILTWHKTNPIPTCFNSYLSDTEYCLFFREPGVELYGSYETKFKYFVTPLNKDDKDKYGHPTPKPVFILENLITNSSKEGEVVLDCFMGSGSTGVAAINLNRNFIGIEINEKYFNIAKQRINDELAQGKLF